MPALTSEEARTTNSVRNETPDVDAHSAGLNAVLRTVCRLAKAASAQLFELDPWGGGILTLANTLPDVPAQLESALCVPSVTETRTMPPPADARWVPGPSAVDASLVAKLGDRPTGILLLALSFNDADAVARTTAKRSMPDLAMLLKTVVERDEQVRNLEQRYASAVAALDDAECGMIAVRADHTIVFSNAAATTILAESDGLYVTRGLLRPTQYADVARLQAALDSVTQPSPQTGSKRLRALVMMLKPDGKRRPKIVVVAPAGRRVQPVADILCAKALVYVLEPNAQPTPGIVALCGLHGMSKVEARLACHLCEGLTLQEAAVEMRIKLETARAYLKQAFAKTETHRQAELVTLLTRYVRAMRGNYDFQAA